MSAASFPDLLSCQRVWLTGLFIPAPDDSLQSPSGSVGSSAACARQPGESGLTESSHNKHTASQPHRCRVYPYSRRERWFDQNARNTHPWVGARWVSDFDEALKKRKSDSNGAPVQVVEQEDGYKIAAQIIEESPQIVERVWNLINANLVPQGSVARVERAIAINNDALHGRIAQHAEVLRDIRNHARAFELASAEVPFLHPVADEFYSLLDGDDCPPKAAIQSGSRPSLVAEVAHETIRLLELLDESQPYGSLERFLGSEGHDALVQWMHNTTECAREIGPQNVGAFLSERLVSELELDRLEPTLLSSALPGTGVEKSVKLGEIGAAILGMIIASGGAELMLASLALGIGLYRSGVGMARRLGWIPQEGAKSKHCLYWYAFGEPGTTKYAVELSKKIRQYRQRGRACGT